jgi:hypothetical protein
MWFTPVQNTGPWDYSQMWIVIQDGVVYMEIT